MRTILRRQVLTGLVVAQFPAIADFVTGGNPQNGKTEAGQMRRMPQIIGVPDNRIIGEDK